MKSYRLLAATLALVTVLSVFAPLGAVAADTNDDGDDVSAADGGDGVVIDVAPADEGYVVTVTDDGDGVEDADVNVSTDNESETFATDENGTFTLETPDNETEVAFETTVAGERVETTETLEPADEAEESESFGALVSAFVEDARSDGLFGLSVANFVVENNPGNAPAHAGPPSHAGPPGEDTETTDTQGPPDHADGVDEDEEGDTDGGGPPSHASASE